MSEEVDYIFRVGKSSILLRFCDNSFSNNYFSTIGVDFKIRTVEIDGKKVKLQIWDTAGQERFQTITSSYYHNSDGIVIVYDITDKESFKLVEKWSSEASRLASPSVCKIIVGNKCDLTDQRQVKEEEGKSLAMTLQMPFIETSAKSSENIEEMFLKMASVIKEKKSGNEFETTPNPEINLQSGKKVSKCSC